MATNYRGAKTLEQLRLTQSQAVRFARNFLKNEEMARRLESETLTEYAERKKIRIKNSDEQGKTNEK